MATHFSRLLRHTRATYYKRVNIWQCMILASLVNVAPNQVPYQKWLYMTVYIYM